MLFANCIGVRYDFATRLIQRPTDRQNKERGVRAEFNIIIYRLSFIHTRACASSEFLAGFQQSRVKLALNVTTRSSDVTKTTRRYNEERRDREEIKRRCGEHERLSKR